MIKKKSSDLEEKIARGKELMSIKEILPKRSDAYRSLAALGMTNFIVEFSLQLCNKISFFGLSSPGTDEGSIRFEGLSSRAQRGIYTVVWTKRSQQHMKQAYDYISKDFIQNAAKLV